MAKDKEPANKSNTACSTNKLTDLDRGRPRGSTNKLTAAQLLLELRKTGLPFEQALARNYLEAQGDPKLRFEYDRLFLGKLMADQHHVQIDESVTVESRQQAFLKALQTFSTVDPAAAKLDAVAVEYRESNDHSKSND